MRDSRNPLRPEKPLTRTDLEGVTEQSEKLGAAMAEVLGEHWSLPKEPNLSGGEDLLTEFEKTSKEVETEKMMREAREAIGEENFLGPEAIERGFGLEIDIGDIPRIPYSAQELREAKDQGYMLVLRLAEDSDGNPMNMARIIELQTKQMEESGEEGTVNSNHWFLSDDKTKDLTPKTEWKLISKDLVPDSTSKNYAEQTKILRDTLKSQNALTKDELDECSDAFLDKIIKQMEDDSYYSAHWQEIAEQLANLKINQNHRRNLPEVFWDQRLRTVQNGDVGTLESSYDWINSLVPGGVPVSVGNFGSRGADVNDWAPRYSGGGVGVCSVR